MNCPDCGGAMWDNRAKKASGQYKPNRADFSCKDKDNCNKGVWLKDGEAAPASNGNGHHAPTAGARAPNIQRPLGPLYNECLKFAKEACTHYFGDATTPADVIAAAATLFIQAVRDGGTIRAAKPAPAPPPPPPPPAPAYGSYDDRDLPF